MLARAPDEWMGGDVCVRDVEGNVGGNVGGSVEGDVDGSVDGNVDGNIDGHTRMDCQTTRTPPTNPTTSRTVQIMSLVWGHCDKIHPCPFDRLGKCI